MPCAHRRRRTSVSALRGNASACLNSANGICRFDALIGVITRSAVRPIPRFGELHVAVELAQIGARIDIGRTAEERLPPERRERDT